MGHTSVLGNDIGEPAEATAQRTYRHVRIGIILAALGFFLAFAGVIVFTYAIPVPALAGEPIELWHAFDGGLQPPTLPVER